MQSGVPVAPTGGNTWCKKAGSPSACGGGVLGEYSSRKYHAQAQARVPVASTAQVKMYGLYPGWKVLWKYLLTVHTILGQELMKDH
jgi:hypothetical protein